MSIMSANALWQKQPKANAELFALTYGALIGELLRDIENPRLIEQELDKMGHSMGIRCMEEFLAKNGDLPETTKQFGETTAELLKTALKMFLGLAVESNSVLEGGNTVTKEMKGFALTFTDNPFTIFVELPEETDLQYNQLLAGMCRGMLEVLQFDCACAISKSMMHGNDSYEVSIVLNQVLQEGAGEDYHDE
jgi:hypothetical protein